MDGVKEVMRNEPWNPENRFPWTEIGKKWKKVWDANKPIMLEKSPPNILRAFEIQKAFSPSYFIAMVRDPYAFCESLRRRNGTEMEDAGGFWVMCAEHQKKNIEGLKRIIHFTYEDLADRPVQRRNQMLTFLPDLLDLDITKSFRIHSIKGRRSRPIQNLNRQNIDRLSPQDIHRINSALEDHHDLMEFYGYKLIHPTNGHSPGHKRSGLLGLAKK